MRGGKRENGGGGGGGETVLETELHGGPKIMRGSLLPTVRVTWRLPSCKAHAKAAAGLNCRLAGAQVTPIGCLGQNVE